MGLSIDWRPRALTHSDYLLILPDSLAVSYQLLPRKQKRLHHDLRDLLDSDLLRMPTQ